MPIVLPAPPRLSGDSGDIETIYSYLKRVYSQIERNPLLARSDPITEATLPTTAATPATPAGLVSFGFYKQILLVWDYDPNPAIRSYEVSRASASGGTYTILSNTSGFTFWDTDLATSAAWYYKVRAVLVDGSTFSSLTASTTATTLASDAGVMALLPTAAAAIQAAATL